MNQLIDLSKKTLIFGFISWLIPLAVSFFLVDPQTKQYVINFWLFKLIMAALLGVVVYYFFSKRYKAQELTIKIPNTVMVINLIGDLLILIGLFKLDFYYWVSTIVTIYLMVIYGIYYYIIKR